MRKYILAGAFAVFVSGVTSYTVSFRQTREDHKAWPIRDVRVTSVESTVDPDGNETFTAMRWQTSEPGKPGQWKVVRKPIGSPGTFEYSKTGDGSFADNGTGRVRVRDGVAEESAGTLADERMHTAASFLHSPDYVGT